MIKKERFEIRTTTEFMCKLEAIQKNAAGIRSKAAAIEYAVDIAIRHLGINQGEPVAAHCQQALNHRKKDVRKDSQGTAP